MPSGQRQNGADHQWNTHGNLLSQPEISLPVY